MKKARNNVFIISAPSGAGKSSLIQLVMAQVPGLFFSTSHTTRPPRQGEKEGVDYFFVDNKTFQQMIQQDEFLEWAEVHGYYYGTSRKMIEASYVQGKDLLLDLDTQGAARVRQLLSNTTSIFIMPPSFSSLEERLNRRKQDKPEEIRQRIQNARQEIQHYKEYDFVVINEEINSALESLVSIIRGQRCRTGILEDKIENILESFKNTHKI